MIPKRGNVVMLGEEKGEHKFCLVISSDVVNEDGGTCILASLVLPTEMKDLNDPSLVAVSRAESDLQADMLVCTPNIFPVAQTKIAKLFGSLEEETMQKVSAALMLTLGIPRGTASPWQ